MPTVRLPVWYASSVLISVPLLSFGDTDGDRRIDIAYYKEEAIGVFRQKDDGTFLVTESRDLTAGKKQKRGNKFVKFDVPPRVADFNGDGLLDVALIYPIQGRVNVYYGTPGDDSTLLDLSES
jgi:hypothetical protein